MSSGASYPGVTFASELQDGTHLGGTVYKELQHLCAQIEAILRAAGIQADGTFENLVTNNITIINGGNIFNAPPVTPGYDGGGTGSGDGVGGVGVTPFPFPGGNNCVCEAAVPAGSLAFTGFGDDPMKFLSPDGLPTLAPAPSEPVEPGSGCDGIVALTTSGRVCITGGNTPNFGTTGIGIFNTDLTVHAQGASGAHGFGGRSIARDDSGNFYVADPTLTGYIFRYTEGGAQTGDWQVGNTPIAIAVNAAGTIAYFVEFGAQDTVKAWDLSGNTSLGTFVTNAGFSVNHNALLCIGSDLLVGWKKAATTGYIKHYSAAAATLYTYNPLGSVIATTVLTPGLTDFSFWCGYYDGTVSTSAGVRIVEIQVGTGAILHQFAPEDGGFQFDGSFCVLRVGVEQAA